MQRPADRVFLGSLNRDLTLRPLREIFCGDSLLERSVQESCQETSYRDPVQRFDLARTPLLEVLYRDIA